MSLIPSMTQLYGAKNVFVSDIRDSAELQGVGYAKTDATDLEAYRRLVAGVRPQTLYHLPALMSGSGEKDPDRCVHLNNTGFANALKVAVENRLRLFVPSTIAAFGFNPDQNGENIPNDCFQRPKSIYGVTKVYMELLGEYHARRYGLDFRSLRYPGIISPLKAYGGTTDYLTGGLSRHDRRGREGTALHLLLGEGGGAAVHPLRRLHHADRRLSS